MTIKTKAAALLVAATMAVSMPVTAFAYVNEDINASGTSATESDKSTETKESEAATEPKEDTTQDDSLESILSDLFKTDNDSDQINLSMSDIQSLLSLFGEVEDTSSTNGKVTVSESSSLNVRSGPGLDYSIIDSLKRGEEVTVQGTDGDWYKITIPATEGYVHKDYLEVSESDGEVSVSLDPELIASLLSMFFSDSETSTPALTPDGNLNLVDDIGSESSGKQFITVATKSGNYFYILIDRDDEGNQTVHFLNLVDESDLLSLMDEEQVAEYQAAVEAGKTEEEAVPEVTTPTAEEQEEIPEEVEETDSKINSGILMLAVIVAALAAAGGGWFYLQSKKKKQEEAKPDPAVRI